MNNENLVGVITPNYNGIEFIDRVIKTVKDQTIPNVKHYIYDDFSNDNSVSLLQTKMDDSALHIIFGQENRGQSHGRNCLIKQAIQDGCKYIAFLDVDDLWDANHLEISLPYLENHDFVYGKPRWVLEDGQWVFPTGIPIPNFFIGKHLQFNNFIWISTVVGKAENFKNVEFDSRLDSIEDWDMWLQQYKLGKKFIDKYSTTVTYLMRDSGQAGKGPQKYGFFQEKHNRIPHLKLNLACGSDYQHDYINVDLYLENSDVQFDVRKIPYESHSVDEIRAFGIIENFNFYESQEVLAEWYRSLKPGGRLWLETPDFLSSCEEFVRSNSQDRINLYDHFFSTPWKQGYGNKFLFTEEQLVTQLSWAGFKHIRKLLPMQNNSHLFLNIEAFK